MRTPEELREAYDKGASVADLAYEDGISVQTMRRILGRTGPIRDGGGPRGFINRPTHEPNTEHPTGVHKVRWPKDAKGHRRRGRNL